MQVKIEKVEPLRIINFFAQDVFTPKDTPLLLKPNNLCNNEHINQIVLTANVEQCLLCNNLLAIKIAPQSAFSEDMYMEFLAQLDDFFAQDLPRTIKATNADLQDLAEAVADSFIRPTLMRDQGNVEISKIEGNILYVKFTGHCAGCPYAKNTLNNVVAKVFKQYLPLINGIVMQES